MSNLTREDGPDPGDLRQPPAGRSSLQLLARARAGDRAALDELFGRQLPALRRWARGRLAGWARNVHDTSDLIQDAALRTFRRLAAFEPTRDKALQAYLRQAVQNRISDEYRRIAVHGLGTQLDEGMPDEGPSPLDLAVSADVEARYRGALARLSPADRELVAARVELGYSHEQLALVSGRRSPNAARVALRRALVKLAAEMQRA
jgi:RNA polymerase sigma-70 factor (ECF subfamily)